MSRKTAPAGDGLGAVAVHDAAQPAAERAMCEKLCHEIVRVLPKALAKVWHGAPVWFVGETPVVGYSVPARGGVSLLFWNGQTFGEKDLEPMGSFKAAQIHYAHVDEIRVTPLRRWVKCAGTQLWDLNEVRARRSAAKKSR